MFVLHLLQGPRQGEEFDVDRELTLGRENVDVVIEDEELSRRHAVVRISDGDLQIEDMGSLNGTLVNNLPISAVTRLVAGDLIEVGSTVLEVRVRDDDPGKTVLKTRLPEPDVAPDTGPMQPEPPPDSDPTMVVVRDPTEIEHEVSPAPVAGGQPPPLPPIPSAPPAPAAVPVRFLFSGQRYLLGETSGMYGIWDRSAPGTPVESFPRDDEGWHRAWETFSAREPDAQRVADEGGWKCPSGNAHELAATAEPFGARDGGRRAPVRRGCAEPLERALLPLDGRSGGR